MKLGVGGKRREREEAIYYVLTPTVKGEFQLFHRVVNFPLPLFCKDVAIGLILYIWLEQHVSPPRLRSLGFTTSGSLTETP
jgi:hypothetical protein